MPTLPTLTVTDAQAARITAAFNGDVAQYRRWLKEQIVDAVISHEAAQEQIALAEKYRNAHETFAAELPTT